MLKVFNEMLKVVAEIDTKIIEDFDDPQIETTGEMVQICQAMEDAHLFLKIFKDMTSVYAENKF